MKLDIILKQYFICSSIASVKQIKVKQRSEPWIKSEV